MDLQRRNDLDGGGKQSEEALASFTVFFLESCIDQVKFMAEPCSRPRCPNASWTERRGGRIRRTLCRTQRVFWRTSLPIASWSERMRRK